MLRRRPPRETSTGTRHREKNLLPRPTLRTPSLKTEVEEHEAMDGSEEINEEEDMVEADVKVVNRIAVVKEVKVGEDRD